MSTGVLINSASQNSWMFSTPSPSMSKASRLTKCISRLTL